jgi:hypothetical protein
MLVNDEGGMVHNATILSNPDNGGARAVRSQAGAAIARQQDQTQIRRSCQRCPVCADEQERGERCAWLAALVDGKGVKDDDVAGPQGRRELGFVIGRR